jgi:anti-sigma B factor antagonist
VTIHEERHRVRVQVVGELDVCTGPTLTHALGVLRTGTAIPAQRRPDVVVDLSGLTFLDTAGLSALADARLVLRTAGSGFRLVRPQPQVGRLLTYAAAAGWLARDALDPEPG